MLGQDGYPLVIVFALVVVGSSGQGICSCVLLALDVMNFVVILGEFKYFPCDASVNVLRGSPVLKILVIRINLDFVGGVRQQPSPISECTYDGVEF